MAARDVLLEGVNDSRHWFDREGRPRLMTVSVLTDLARQDPRLMSALASYTSEPHPRVELAIASLVASEAVPAAAALRLKREAMQKYRDWQDVWGLQRAEDRGERVKIPLPSKYTAADFQKSEYWSARGKLDVPKERFIAYPGARRSNDDTAVYGWAGWNHAEQGLAASSLLVEMAGAGANTEQLMPVFAALIELEPWIAQWHSAVDPAYGVSPATAVSGVVDHQLARAGLTRDDVDAWRPAATTRGRRTAASTVSATPTA
jgi:hypothetical protein